MPVLVGSSPTALEEFDLDLPSRAYLGDSGIVLADGTVSDAYSCRWKWAPTNGWGPKPAPREQVGDRSYDHGQWDATRYFGPRVLTIPGTVRAPDHAALHFAEQRLRDAVSVTGLMLRITEPGFDSYAMARQQGEVLWTENSHTHASYSMGLYAADPRIWSMLERSFVDLSFPSITGGLEWPVTWGPVSWDADVVSGSRQLLNPGNLPAGLQLRVDGPVGTASIVFSDLGDVLNLENPEGNLLTTGEWLDIDTANRRVLLNGDAGRRSWAYGDWLLLPPGEETTLAIAGTGVTADSRVSGSYRAARI